MRIGLHKEPSLRARVELFATNVRDEVATCSKSSVPRRGNCADHNVRSEYVRGTIMSSLSAE